MVVNKMSYDKELQYKFNNIIQELQEIYNYSYEQILYNMAFCLQNELNQHLKTNELIENQNILNEFNNIIVKCGELINK